MTVYMMYVYVCNWFSEYDFAEVNSRGFIMREAEGCSFESLFIHLPCGAQQTLNL